MTDKELQHLRRSELLEILLAQQKQIDSLKKELAEAKEQLAERKIVLEKSGSIAEAALKLNGIFEAAQQAADHKETDEMQERKSEDAGAKGGKRRKK